MREIYKSQEWKGLDPVDRAQLLLVMEGVKRGTIVEGNHTSFLEILRLAGLDYRLESEPLVLRPDYVIARKEDLLEFEKRRRELVLSGSKMKELDKLVGWFYGYPDCCTEEYSRPRTETENGSNQVHMSYKFGRELHSLISETGKYPEVFDYCPPAFTPCGVECFDARKMLGRYKELLDELDPEAAAEITYFSRSKLPNRRAHTDYFAAESDRRNTERLMNLLKNPRSGFVQMFGS